MSYLELLKLLLPYSCYSDSDLSNHLKDMAVCSQMLQKGHANADDLFNDEIFPDKTNALLTDWERVYGIISDSENSYGQRIDNLLTAINVKGGLSKEYFIRLAQKFGYTITIDEFVPFMAGWSEAGDDLYIEDIIYVWEVKASGKGIWYFEAGVSCAGDSLGYLNDSKFENLFNKLKPAHTHCVFSYQQ